MDINTTNPWFNLLIYLLTTKTPYIFLFFCICFKFICDYKNYKELKNTVLGVIVLITLPLFTVIVFASFGFFLQRFLTLTLLFSIIGLITGLATSIEIFTRWLRELN